MIITIQSVKICLVTMIVGSTLLFDPTTDAAFSMVTGSHFTAQSRLKRLIKEDGWEIPGLAKSKIMLPRRAFQDYSEKPVSQLYVTEFKPIGKAVAAIPIYFIRKDGEEIVTRQQQITVKSIEKYDVNKKAFCFIVSGIGISHDKKTGQGGYAGGFSFVYYDNDGDGKFETYELAADTTPPFVPHVPEWVSH